MIRYAMVLLILTFPSLGPPANRPASAANGASRPKTISVTLSNAHWTAVPLPFQPISVRTHDGKLWTCGWDEGIAESADGGNTWRVLHIHRNGEILFGLAFSTNRIYAFGTRGFVWISNDGGHKWKHWYQVPVPAAEGRFCANTGLASAPGAFEFTVNGRNWTSRWLRLSKYKISNARTTQEKVQRLVVPDVACLDPQHAAVLVHGSDTGTGPRFYFTKDAGKTWSVTVFHQGWKLIHVAARNGVYTIYGSTTDTRTGQATGIVLYSSDGAHWNSWPIAPKAAMLACSGFTCLAAGGWADFTTSPPEFWRSPPLAADMKGSWTASQDVECSVGTELFCALGTKADAGSIAMPLANHREFAQDGSEVQKPRCSHCEPAAYPSSAVLRGCEGITVFSVSVATDGTVQEPALLYAPCKALAEATIKSFSHWRLIPEQVNGKPAEARILVEYVYKFRIPH